MKLLRKIIWGLGFPLFFIGLEDQVFRLIQSNFAFLNLGQLTVALVVFCMWLILIPDIEV